GLPTGFGDVFTGSGAEMAQKAAPPVPGAVAGFQARGGFGGVATAARRGRRVSTRGGARVGGAGAGQLGGVLGAIKSSVIVGGLISIGVNGYQAIKGQQTWRQAGTAVAGDLASAAVGGAAGAAASAIATPMLAGMLGAGSLIVTLGSIGVGIAAYAVADSWLRKTPFFQKMTGTVSSTLQSLGL
ncbi:MAG: hypothetical protein ACLGIN_10315, partial [Candidatus Sericytochromatia bacterium]